MFCSDQNSGQTLLGWLKEENGSDVDKYEQDFEVLNDKIQFLK
jgi:hypothetical protein